ncbi:MAG: hypothetical protein ACI4PZ_07445 [Akkermansia sp.]
MNSSTTTDMTLEKLENILSRTMSTKRSELLSLKKPGKQYLDAADMDVLCDCMECIWLKHCDTVPPQIKGASNLAKAILAPDVAMKIRLIKDAICVLAGTGGIAVIISAVGAALGWGAGVISSIIAIFTGTSLLGPIALVALGAAATIVAGYFMFSDVTDEELSQRAFKALKDSTLKALPAIWKEYGSRWHD